MTKDTILHKIVHRLLLLLVMMTVGVGEMWGQPFTVTTDTDHPVYYLFQSFGNTGFYMRSNGTAVHTLNILTDDMKWYFLDSDESGYYYICDKDGKYLYFSQPYGSQSSRTWMELKNSLDNNDTEHYKFSIAKNNTQGWDAYNIIPYGNTGSYCLNKQGRNSGTNGVQVASGYDDENSNWVFILLTTYEWTLRTDCFRPSDSSNKYFYRIKCRKNGNYYIKPGTDYVETSNTVDDDMICFFEEAASDELMTYYYIRHANTGQYLRYRSNAVGQDNAIELTNHTGSETDDDEARFQFIVVRGAVANEAWNATSIFFNIVPKLLKSTSSDINIKSVSCDKGLGSPLKTKSNRNSDDTQWSFVSVEYSTVCANPTIAFSSSTGKATISTATTRSTIYYTIDGTEPSSSNGTAYTTPFDVTEETTIKAIVTRTGFTDSEVTTETFYKVVSPTIQNNEYSISIATETDGATIYYTTNGSEPTTSSTEYTSPLSVGVSGATIKAIAVKDGMVNSAVASKSGAETTLRCATPTFTKSGTSLTINCDFPSSGVSIYYIKNGGDSEPTTPYSGSITVAEGDVVKAVAKTDGYNDSYVGVKIIRAPLSPTDGKYLITNDTEFESFVDMANSAENDGYHYVLQADVNASVTVDRPFTGTFEAAADANGNFYKISGLNHALFNTINGGTVKNVMLDNVSISSGTNVGAICNEATGASRIYNCGVLATGSTVTADDDGYTEITSCSSTISGSNYVGGLVGLLDGSSRVINCFSYANITGGDKVGGIVGWNNVATTSANLATMVMNCMFYGDITGGTSKAPIYNGEIITNDGDADGVNNFNYFWSGASYVQGQNIDVYNCALAAETRFLQRFEFFRHLLNSNRELAAWWATDNAANKDEVMKWVMEPSQIGTTTPYPILKAPDRYPSVVNIDVNHSETYKGRDMTVGPKLNNKTLSVTIRNSTTDAVYGAPVGADITQTTPLTLNITDKDPDHFNFNYGKVQLPYYNDVGTGNYTGNRVVTGWKIVSISGGTTTYSTDNDDNAATPADAEADVDAKGDITLTTPYNFADRKCTQKDLYGTSGSNRVFSQGAYWDVPEGVTAITIEPYWGKAVYLSDAYWDVTYKNSSTDAMATAANVPNVGGGQHYNNGVSTFNGQLVYTSMGDAISSTNSTGLYVGIEGDSNDHTVYDYAVVLVGNYHNNAGLEASNSKPYTVTSVDLDGDNEPDYSYIPRFNGRLRVHPVRIDFLNAIGLGMAQKSTGGTGTYNFGIMQPKGWFESTNTSVFRVTQFEYDYDGRTESPMILQGGVIEQWVTVGGSEQSIKEAKSVSYYHVGGNVWFKEFHIGVHQDKTQDEFHSPHPPISVTGGDFDEFYLTGLYNTPQNNAGDNAECYINGGRFGKVAGTGMQGIGKTGGADKTGNIIWQIDNADIDEFYAGGINAAHIAEGNLYTVITNSRVDQFCGGPKFGNMNSDKKVVTNAENCTFRTFFGAGYGGNSYNRRYPANQNNKININWNSWLIGAASYDYSYDSGKGGVETRIDYQFLPNSGNTTNVCRLFIDHVSFSLATTHDVTSKLTNCIITKDPLGRLDLFEQCLGNFYGGGSLGKVDGPVTSILTNCTVEGNVFGAGYSASKPTVSVMNNAFQTEPHYDENLGAYLEAELPSTETYNWQHLDESIADAANDAARTALAIDKTNHILYTNENLDKSNLGSVNGQVTLIITTSGDGETVIGTEGNTATGHVYGGGDESYVINETNPASASTIVTIKGKTEVKGNVFGGGNNGEVSGSTTVNIE